MFLFKRFGSKINTFFNRRNKKVLDFKKTAEQLTAQIDAQRMENNMENNMGLQEITKGHYQLTSTIGSENPEIIRIYGPDFKNPGYWIIDGNKNKYSAGKTLHENVIRDLYTKIAAYKSEAEFNSTKSKQKHHKKVLSNIMSDFEPIEVDVEEIPPQREEKNSSQREEKNPQQEHDRRLKTLQKTDDEKLFEKILTSAILQDGQEYLLSIKSRYDIGKLKQLADLMSINIDKIFYSVVTDEFTKILDVTNVQNNQNIQNIQTTLPPSNKIDMNEFDDITKAIDELISKL